MLALGAVMDGILEDSQDQRRRKGWSCLQRCSKGVSRVCPTGPSFGVWETALSGSWAPCGPRSFSSSANISCSCETLDEGSPVFAQVTVFIVREGIGYISVP